MKDHPAKFNAEIKEEMFDILLDEMDALGHAPLVLDPFAGVGGIHDIWPVSVGVELEREWAQQSEKATIQGNALTLPFASETISVVATSPCYGNRMADHHNAKEKCRPCKGTGHAVADGNKQWVICPKCEGKGRREYDRLTYRHKLGRMPSEGSSAVMQWGPAYRSFHEEAWWEVHRVLEGNGLFLLNIGDHIRKHKRVQVSKWHHRTIIAMGFECERRIKVKVPKMKKGANRDARVPYEYVLAFRKVQ